MKQYFESCKSKFWKEVFEKETDYLKKELKEKDKILSIGCGYGIIEKGLIENNFDLTGLDVSKTAIKDIQANIELIIGSAQNMGFKENSFEAAIYVVSLQFISNIKKAMQETARILNKSGKIIIMLLNPKSTFFKEKKLDKESYIKKIKHTNLTYIQKTINRYFDINKTEYYLGIKNKQIFMTSNPNFAALYIIQGTKK